MLSNTLRLNFGYLKIIYIPHPYYHLKIIGYILKNKKNNKRVCIYEIIRLIKIKIKIKMKNRSQRYDINGPRSKHEHKFSKHNTRHTMMMLIYIKQHLSNT